MVPVSPPHLLFPSDLALKHREVRYLFDLTGIRPRVAETTDASSRVRLNDQAKIYDFSHVRLTRNIVWFHM